MDLRDWQIKATEFFNENNNSLMEVTTGAGKTFLSIYIIKQLLKSHPNLRVLIVGPKNVILEKTWMPELNTFGFPINKVGLYNEFAKEINQVTLISIQSLKSKIDKDGGIYDSGTNFLTNSLFYNMFDFVIFDEIHNYATQSYLKIVRIPKQFKLGLSATLKRDDMREILLKHTFNHQIFKYNIKNALEDNVLNPFEFTNIILPIDEETFEQYDEISTNIKKCLQISGDKSSDRQNDSLLKKLINQRKQLIYNYPLKFNAVKDIILKNKSSKILVFNQYNKTSNRLYWQLLEFGCKVDIINSDISRNEQSKIFKRFEKGETNILLATTMLDEGYNLPKIDVAIIMAANSTEKQFYQRMGRVLRKKDINSKVFYLTVDKTFEVEYLENKLELIKEISCKFNQEVF